MAAIGEGQMRFRVLGSLDIRSGHQWVGLGRPRRRAVLAYLLLAANRIVTVGELIEAIWGTVPPSTARSQIQSDVAAIRKVLANSGMGESIVTTTGGYQLVAAAEQIDYHLFRRRVAEAAGLAERGNWIAASRKLSEAVALWRGAPLADVIAAFAGPCRALLEGQRLDAVERLAEARVNAGASDEQIPVLRELVAAHPERERPAMLLMLALHRSGRRADALAVARDVRAFLREHHGLDPSQQFLDTERHILRDFDEVEAPPGDDVPRPTAPKTEVRAVPKSWLPRPPNGFVGREDVVRRMTRSVDESDQADESLVWMIDGMPGVGKTTLAVHVARQLKDRYPDGQLFVDLYGHADGSARKTGAALGMLLGQLGYATAALPSGVEGRAALWRDELARRRCVVVLDNAASSGQIAPLLPDAAGSLVIVTSRRRLTNTTGAWVESLPVLRDSESVRLLAAIAGEGRVDAEPAAAAQIGTLCGHLPLALRLAGARVRRRATWSLADLAVRLREGSVLAHLSAEDRTVTAAFSTSYERLTVGAQTAFRVIGVLPVDDVTAHSITAATGGVLDQTRRNLDELADANLVVEHDVERYRLHDLLKSYAASLANAIDTADVRAGWVTRCYEYYAAAAILNCPPDGRPEVVARDFETGPRVARELVPASVGPRWFETELVNLLLLIRRASAAGQLRHGGQLAMAMWRHLYNNGAAEEIVETQTVVLETARTLGNDGLAAAAHNYIASGHYFLGNPTAAERHLLEAMELRRAGGDWDGFYASQSNLALVFTIQGRVSAAARMLREAIGYGAGAGLTAAWLSGLGKAYWKLGEVDAALRVGRAALFYARQTGDRRRIVTAVAALAETRLRAGHLDAAHRMLHLCLRINQRQRNFDAADILNDLGNVYRARELYDEAEAYCRQALETCTATGAGNVRAKVLNDLAHTLLASGKPGAIEAFEGAARQATTVGNVRERARALHGMAICLTDQDLTRARQHLTVALALFEQADAPERFEVARQLAQLDPTGERHAMTA